MPAATSDPVIQAHLRFAHQQSQHPYLPSNLPVSPAVATVGTAEPKPKPVKKEEEEPDDDEEQKDDNGEEGGKS